MHSSLTSAPSNIVCPRAFPSPTPLSKAYAAPVGVLEPTPKPWVDFPPFLFSWRSSVTTKIVAHSIAVSCLRVIRFEFLGPSMYFGPYYFPILMCMLNCGCILCGFDFNLFRYVFGMRFSGMHLLPFRLLCISLAG